MLISAALSSPFTGVDSTPTPPSPIKGEGFRAFCASRALLTKFPRKIRSGPIALRGERTVTLPLDGGGQGGGDRRPGPLAVLARDNSGWHAVKRAQLVAV